MHKLTTSLQIDERLPVHLVKIKKWYYARKNERVNGVPRVVFSYPLGTAEEILACARKATPNLDQLVFQTFEFGKPAALLAIAEELKFFDVVSDATRIPPKGELSTAQFLFTIIAGRGHGPLSKSGTGEWFDKTFLNLIWTPRQDLSCQNFLNHMDKLTPATQEKIGESLARRLIELGLRPTTIFWDPTNFSTCMDQWDDEGMVRPGNAKDKRFDRNIVGMGIAATREAIPILHEAAAGNESDVTFFNRMIERLTKRLTDLRLPIKDMVLVLDRGNNSPENLDAVLDKMHIIGGLKRSQFPELLDVPIKDFSYLYRTDNGNIVKGFRTTREIEGRNMTVIVTYNEGTAKRQAKVWRKAMKKIVEGMNELQSSYGRKGGKGRPMSLKGLTESIHDLVKKQYRSVVWFDVNQENRRLEWGIDQKKEEKLRLSFGKSTLFTDLSGWPTKRIVKSYNGKYVLEDDFKWFHQKILLPVIPIFHHSSSEERIKTHMFLCVLGMIFLRYMVMKLRRFVASAKELWDELEHLRVVLVQDRRTKKLKFAVEQMSMLQAKAFNKLDLGRYLPSG